ncbi:MAG: hypothetical protein ACJAZO_004870 [Myxococcota bacterium]|jgi:hypothetical protein
MLLARFGSTFKTALTVGQRVAFRGVLRADVDIGFGYPFDALVREAEGAE